jgi:hypothetical protein
MPEYAWVIELNDWVLELADKEISPRVKVPNSDPVAVSSADSGPVTPWLSTSVDDSCPLIVNRFKPEIDRRSPASDRLWRTGMTEPRISPVNAISMLPCFDESRKDRRRRSMVESRMPSAFRTGCASTIRLDASEVNNVCCSCALDRAVEQLSEKTSINARSTESRCVTLARRRRIVKG